MDVGGVHGAEEGEGRGEGTVEKTQRMVKYTHCKARKAQFQITKGSMDKFHDPEIIAQVTSKNGPDTNWTICMRTGYQHLGIKCIKYSTYYAAH